jgi:Type I phosphodiesterase / nucleotide pyrophosphatase
VTYDESKDFNSSVLFSGGINPLNLPQSLVNGKCTYIYPHMRLRVNTVFEIVHEVGMQTAYTDKHPAYDIVRGPSGKGLSVGYFPEIAAIGPSVEDTIAYDQLHVDAFLDWIKGTTPDYSEVQDKLTDTPRLFGGNFQAVSVGQKTSGYVAKTLDFTPELIKALDFVDSSLGKVVEALKDKNIFDDTLIIVASKHGQAPIDPTKYAKVDPSLIPAATGVNVSFVTTDDIALIFLQNHADTDAAVAGLNSQRFNLRIQDIIYGPQLIAEGFGNPLTDTAVPDIIVRPIEGIIYTTSTAKIAEHGGLNEDDRHVACFVSSPNLKATKFPCRVSTRQVAPTILRALGLDTSGLQGAKLEGTQPLDGFGDNDGVAI